MSYLLTWRGCAWVLLLALDLSLLVGALTLLNDSRVRDQLKARAEWTEGCKVKGGHAVHLNKTHLCGTQDGRIID